MTDRQPAVYILASKPNGTLYVGVTSDLKTRVWQHKTGSFSGFTKKYAVHHLVYYEFLGTMQDAINREKALKKWNRAWKVELIKRTTRSGGTCTTNYIEDGSPLSRG